MFVANYQKNTLLNLAGVFIIGLLFWLPSFFYPVHEVSANGMPGFTQIATTVSSSRVFETILSWLLLCGQGFYLNFLVLKNNIFGRGGYMVAMVYVVLGSSSPSLLEFHPFLITNYLLILMLDLITGMYRQQQALFHPFYSGFVLAISCLFYFPLFLLLPFIWISVIIIKPASWRDPIAVLLGFLFPFFVVISYYYWQDSVGYFVTEQIKFGFITADLSYFTGNIWKGISLGGLSLLVGVAILSNLNKGLIIKTILPRRFFSLIYLLAAFALFLFLFIPGLEAFYLMPLFISLAVILSLYFYNQKEYFWSQLFFSLFILQALIKNWMAAA